MRAGRQGPGFGRGGGHPERAPDQPRSRLKRLAVDRWFGHVLSTSRKLVRQAAAHRVWRGSRTRPAARPATKTSFGQSESPAERIRALHAAIIVRAESPRGVLPPLSRWNKGRFRDAEMSRCPDACPLSCYAQPPCHARPSGSVARLPPGACAIALNRTAGVQVASGSGIRGSQLRTSGAFGSSRKGAGTCGRYLGCPRSG
jgi:hypothetical protein